MRVCGWIVGAGLIALSALARASETEIAEVELTELWECESLLASEKYGEALTCFIGGHESHPQDVKWCNGVARAAEKSGDLETASDYASQALALSPSDATASQLFARLAPPGLFFFPRGLSLGSDVLRDFLEQLEMATWSRASPHQGSELFILDSNTVNANVLTEVFYAVDVFGRFLNASTLHTAPILSVPRNQRVTVVKFAEGGKITSHIDNATVGPQVFVFTLAGEVKVTFSCAGRKSRRLTAPAGSVYVTTSDARNKWKRGIVNGNQTVGYAVELSELQV